ncbi:MAG: tetratricopeptide repeat protein [Flaviflexus sp.]|nr:tetratricopeptide repeat protein [Flaviflexus sp.]
MSQPPMMPGAVDLSALAAAKEQARIKEQNTGADGIQRVPGPLVRALTKDNLKAFLETSLQVPLVVTFHSARSEGSLELKTTLSNDVSGRGGALGLGTVDIDTERELVATFQIQAVPTTLAIIGGNPVPLFQGTAGPEDVAKALDNVLAAAAQLGVTGILNGDEDGEPAPPPLPPHVKEAQEAMDAGDLETAKNEYTAALKENPGDDASRIGLLQVELLQRVGDADPQEALSAAKDAELTDVDAHLAAADVEVAYGRPDAGLSRLLDVIKATAGEERERVRQRIVELFDVIGPKEPLVNQARRELASSLM